MPDLAPRRRTGCLILGLIALALMPAPASAWPEERGLDRPRVRHPARARLAPALPPPAIVSGYLPRNNNVPMYNEPPRTGPFGRP